MSRITRHVLVLGLLTACAAAGARRSAAADDLPQREERAMKAAVVRVAPSVVRIETVGGLERVGQILIGTGPTTGLVVAEDGYIVSSAFNFVQKPASILITLEDGSRHAARLVATDHSRMLVLLKIETPNKLSVPEAAPLAEMRVGQWSLAVGRTFEASQPNVSVGIVSAVVRIWGKAVQTDAKISPNNYGGPLVDIAGRVLGVLVPMAPEGSGEVAGVEWYDSGIGFAIPLEDVLRVLPKLREGHDLYQGILGISIKGGDVYGQPAIFAAVRATSPAYKAGFRAGDKVVEAGGRAVTRPAELKQQLGRLYAGDKIKLVATRGSERLEREVELIDKIEPYEHPFLGILPLRVARDQNKDPNKDEEKDPKAAGVTVRYVYPDSPATVAGIKPGDRILKFAGQEVQQLDAILQKMLTLAPDEKVQIELRRGDETLVVEPQLARLPDVLPGELPPAHGSLGPAEAEKPAVGVVTLKVPEVDNECIAYVPENYDPRLTYGVAIWLHAPGGTKQDELVERWKSLCEKHDFILLAPKSTEKAGWQPTEARCAPLAR